MTKILKTLAAVCLFAASSEAQAQCSTYYGKTISPTSFNDVVESLSSVSPKDEFESTSQYSSRINASYNRVKTFIIVKETSSQKWMDYDPDTQNLVVQEYAFSTSAIDWYSQFMTAKAQLVVNPINNRGVEIGESTVVVGYRPGTNAYGVTINVEQRARYYDSIFDSAGQGTRDSLFYVGESEYILGRIKLTPDVARVLKPHLRAAFVVKPKPPFLVTGNRGAHAPTLDTPFEVSETFRTLIANVQCGLLVDSRNRVWAAFTPKGAKRQGW